MTELQRLHDTDCTLLMGVLNITEDSSSDGGLWLDPGKARDHGEAALGQPLPQSPRHAQPQG